jgi:hypothetical protein
MGLGGASPAQFASTLVQQHRLLINETYAFSCTSAVWFSVSRKEATSRKTYEAGAWDELKISEIFERSSSGIVNMVGLAVGEGWGEIELLKKALANGFTVHYLAMDFSPVLLAGHIATIRETFEPELNEGRLICAGFLGNVFFDLENAWNTCRSEFQRREVLSGRDDFLPVSAPLLVTYLGNCLGNDSNNAEHAILNSISSIFPHQLLLILIGVSVMRSAPDQYSPSSADFFLQVPHYLMNDLQLLKSVARAPAYEPEFEVPNESTRDRRMPGVALRDYTFRAIKGQIYDFYYKLDYDLEYPAENKIVDAGTPLLLYSVTKFEPAGLVSFMESLGYAVTYEPLYHQRIDTEFGPREYTVMLACRRP